MEATLAKPRLEDFDVDLAERIVTHRPSRISFVFDVFLNEADWQRAEAKSWRDNAAWLGDSAELARMAKAAAIAEGMKAHRQET